MADKDICWKIDNLDTDAGTLRLRVVHSIANEHFVLSGVRELGGMDYALTGAATDSGSTYKASLLETGGSLPETVEGERSVWSTSWSLELDPKTLDGTAKAITTIYDEGLGASTEAGFFDATLLPCKPKDDDS